MKIDLQIVIGIACTVLASLFGFAGWLSGRERRHAQHSEWRAKMDTKLDLIIGIREEFYLYKERLVIAEQAIKNAHRRIDEMMKGDLFE